MNPRRVSYAQNREDIVLMRALKPEQRLGTWIDVGAGDPVESSVTKAFSDLGWTGINIEPSLNEFVRLCAARTSDTNLQLALGASEGTATFYETQPERPGLSTLNPDIAVQHSTTGPPFSARQTSMTTLAAIVRDYVTEPVDFLKIDVEGFEQEVLEGADWSLCRPRIVVVEAVLPNTSEASHQKWEHLLIDAGYEFALFDGLNRFYVVSEDPELADHLGTPASVVDNFVPYEWSSTVELLRSELESAAEYARSLKERLSATEKELTSVSEALEAKTVDLDTLVEAHLETTVELNGARVQLATALDDHATTVAALHRIGREYASLQVAFDSMKSELVRAESSASAARDLAADATTSARTHHALALRELEIVRSRLEERDAIIHAIYQTRTMRYTAVPRRVYRLWLRAHRKLTAGR